MSDNFDRVRGMVALQSRGRLSHDEQQDAVQRALTKLSNRMIETFRGISMGEWVESTRALVKVPSQHWRHNLRTLLDDIRTP